MESTYMPSKDLLQSLLLALQARWLMRLLQEKMHDQSSFSRKDRTDYFVRRCVATSAESRAVCPRISCCATEQSRCILRGYFMLHRIRTCTKYKIATATPC